MTATPRPAARRRPVVVVHACGGQDVGRARARPDGPDDKAAAVRVPPTEGTVAGVHSQKCTSESQSGSVWNEEGCRCLLLLGPWADLQAAIDKSATQLQNFRKCGFRESSKRPSHRPRAPGRPWCSPAAGRLARRACSPTPSVTTLRLARCPDGRRGSRALGRGLPEAASTAGDHRRGPVRADPAPTLKADIDRTGRRPAAS